jgi:hypothetical protein
MGKVMDDFSFHISISLLQGLFPREYIMLNDERKNDTN